MEKIIPKFYRVSQLVEMLNVSKSSIYLWVSQGKFPKSFKIGGGTSVWSDLDISEWIDSLNKSDEG
jgi:prophage regulatory protein